MNKRKGMLPRALTLLLGTVLLLNLWGCAGRELYERLLIHGIGVDVDGEEFIVTVRSSVSPEDEGEEYFKCRGRSVLEALSGLSLSTGRKPFYVHNYLVVFGRECAERGLDCCLDFFVRYYNTRPAVRIFLAENTAEEILSFQKDGKYLRMAELQQLGDSGRESGKAVRTELLDFVNGAEREGSSPVLPVLRAEEEGIMLTSTACFRGYTLQEFLSPEETRGFLAVKNQLKSSEAVVSGEFGTATLSLTKGIGQVTLERDSQGNPEFAVSFFAKGDISSLSGKSRQPGEKLASLLEEALSALLEEEIRGAVEKALLKNGCDIFGFGNLIYREDPAYWRGISGAWPEKMRELSFRVEVKATVDRLSDSQD